MNPWSWVARHHDGTQRLDEWRRVLGASFAAWEVFLDPVRDPLGIRFWADFGAGQEEHEILDGPSGFLACAVESRTVVPLNPTQAEFRRLRLTALLDAIKREAKLEGATSLLPRTAAGYRLGTRHLGGRRVVMFLVPRVTDLFADIVKDHFAPGLNGADVSLVLTPAATDLTPGQRRDLLTRRMIPVPCPCAAPWMPDLSPLAGLPELGFIIDDPGDVFGRRFALLIDRQQERAYIEGIRLNIRADSQPYKLVSYLAERPGQAVPHRTLANDVLCAGIGERSESKVVDDVKRAFQKVVKGAVAQIPDARVCADDLFVNEGGALKLALRADLVLVRS